MWKYYFSSKSAGEHGTLYQLRNLISRLNVTADSIHHFNECDDFFKLIVSSHIIAVAMEELKMSSMDDIPTISSIEEPEMLWMEIAEERQSVLKSICESIVDKFACFEFNKSPPSSSDMVYYILV